MTPEDFRGLGVSSGVAFGHVQLVDRRKLSVPRHHLQAVEVELELERFEEAVSASETQLEALHSRAKKSGLKEVALLLDAHTAILRDEFLFDATKKHIRDDQINAEWALRRSVRKLRELFDNLDGDYFKERRSDVDLVSDRLMRNLVGEETDTLRNIPEDAIVVAYDLSPADTVALARYHVKAFVTETGGRTSHIAILARDMSLPAVVGVPGIMERAGTGDEVVIDGDSGEVVLRPDDDTRGRLQLVEKARLAREEMYKGERELPAETTDGTRVSLLGNIEVPDEIPFVLDRGGEGIGLYRTEFLVLERSRMPSSEEHKSEYERVIEILGDHPLTVRTIDIGGDKFVRSAVDGSLGSAATTLNPALGLRAIRYSLRDPAAFRSQIKAVLELSTRAQVKILLPFLTGLEELRQAKAHIEQVRTELRSENIEFDEDVPVGVMIETPAAVWCADLFAREVDFFSIGTNDLIQYALAVDRGNEDVAYLYRPCHPAVLRMIHAVARAAREAGIPVTLCGEMAADPFHAPLLVGLGLRSLSMSAPSIPLVKRVIRRFAHADAKAFAELALEMPTARAVERELDRLLKDWAPDLQLPRSRASVAPPPPSLDQTAG